MNIGTIARTSFASLIMLSLVLATPQAARAIPVHLHGPGWTSWESDANIGAVSSRHSHPSPAGDEAGDVSHQHYDAQAFLGPLVNPADTFEPSGVYGVWDNRTAFVDGDAPIFGEYSGAGVGRGYGHGFIQEDSPATMPRYRLTDDTGAGIPQAIQDRIHQAFSLWGAIKADFSPTTGKPLVTGLGFTPTTGAAAEIEVHWRDIAGGSGGGFVEGLPEGLYDDTNDVDMVFDSTRLWDTTVAGADLTRTHFLSVALHEIGHVIFLEHSADRNEDLMAPPVGFPLGAVDGNVSYRWNGYEELAGENDGFIGVQYTRDSTAVGGFTTVNIKDVESANAAKSLYSIPAVPEPASMVLVAIGLFGAALRRSMRKNIAPRG